VEANEIDHDVVALVAQAEIEGTIEKNIIFHDVGTSISGGDNVANVGVVVNERGICVGDSRSVSGFRHGMSVGLFLGEGFYCGLKR